MKNINLSLIWMKKLHIFTIICLFAISANEVAALSYKDSISTDMYYSSLPQTRISEAELLQGYVQSYQEKTNALFIKYKNEKSLTLHDINNKLIKMSRALIRIQNRNINEQAATQVMQSIVSDLKILNNRIKIYIQQENIILENNIEKEKKRYIYIGWRISNVLDRLIDQISKSLIQKKSLSSNEKRIVKSLVNIRKANDKIKNFKNISFSSEIKIRIYFKEIIENIRSEILKIKKYS